MESDRRIHIFAPASGLYKEGIHQTIQGEVQRRPIGSEQNVALTPLAFVMFQDRYDAFVKKYKELNFKTLNEAAKTKGWDEIAGKPEWGPFTFTCANPTEFTTVSPR